MNTQRPVFIHPDNPKYFLFRGKPLVLLCATEHYGSVINRRFNFEKYLDDAADKKQTLTRLFLLFREQQSTRNPYSPCKPESPDFVTPFVRSGPGNAMDGEPRYDLDQCNDEYLERLHRFLALASERNIVVELTLFSNTYCDAVWALNPLRAENNLQGIGRVSWEDYNSLGEPALWERQEAHVRKIVQETKRYDNVYYEICNEPGGGIAGHATPAQVDEWQAAVARVIREEESNSPNRHLIFASEAFAYPEVVQGLDKSFASPDFDVVNVHPLPNVLCRGRRYMMGGFMAKELSLSEIRDFCLAAHAERKPCVLDEDNCASLYRDDVGWTIHRKRAWMALLCGAHYDYIDFSITVGNESGTVESRAKIRSWMRNLSQFVYSFDFVRAQPAPDWLKTKPDHTVAATLSINGTDYIAYVADGREVIDAQAGNAIAGDVCFPLPEGFYNVSLYSPVTGLYSPCLQVQGGRDVTLSLAPFHHDVALRVTRAGKDAT